MRRPTLLGRLVRTQAAVVACACVALAGGSLVVGHFVLRRNQDGTLRSMAASLCHGIPLEAKEKGLDYEPAARILMEESSLEGHRVELRDGRGRVLAGHGELSGWPEGLDLGRVPSCRTLRASVAREELVRACSHACDAGHVVWVGTADALRQPSVLWARVALLAVLPLAVASGAIAGRIVFRRQLLPLRTLQEAASRLDPRRALRLGVGSRTEELVELETAFDGLLTRLGDALDREKRFAQEASHELRTPLTSLRARLESMAPVAARPEEVRRELAAAVADVASLDRLVEALLLLARSESAAVPPATVNLCDLAREVGARQARADGPRSTPPEVDAPDEILVRGSEELLDRAIANLVENARRHAGAAARIRIQVVRDRRHAVVSVADDGPGIPDEVRPFVFERFVRAPGARGRAGGAGLGLAVVRAVAERHGGRVEARRGPLGGEEVRLELPLLDSGAGHDVPGRSAAVPR